MSRTAIETLELQSPAAAQLPSDKKGFMSSVSQRFGQSRSDDQNRVASARDMTASPAAELQDVLQESASNVNTSKELERWNYPKGNSKRICATFWAFMVMGMNDAAYGVSLTAVF